MRKLTDDFVEELAASDRDTFIFDAATEGFALRITPRGTKIFIAQARHKGKQRRVSLGTFGPPDDLSVATARRAARAALEDIRNGKDPAIERIARERAVEAGGTTIEALAERWMDEVVTPKRKPRTAEDYRRLIDQKIKPRFGDKLVTSIEWADVNTWHKDMAKTPRRANYAVATFKALLNFAELLTLRPPHSNPCRRIKMYRETDRERFLSEAEIAKAATAIAKAEAEGKIGKHAAAGLRLALFTGARSGEIKAARWAHLDRSRKVIRLPDSKTNEPRTIHLSDAAMEVIAGIPRVEPFIIAGGGEGGGFSNLTRAWAVARAYGGLEDVRLHDLRHSYASLAVNRGISLPMIGKLLGHKVAATTQRYAHIARDVVADINDQLGAAMTAAIEKPEPKGNVVKMKGRRRRAAK